MKTRKEIEETLKRYKPFLREKFKVKEIGIFGSYVRGRNPRKAMWIFWWSFMPLLDGNLSILRNFWRRFWAEK